MIVELKDKVGVAAAWEAASAAHAPGPREQEMNDAVLALIALGYKQVDALKAVKAATDAKPGQEIPSDELVREALKRLA
jgi:Holliday junction DNA helicase RuvA